VLLAVTLLAAVIVPAALLEHGDLVGLGLGDDLCRNGQAIGRLEAAAVAGEQDIAQRDAVARIAVELLNDDLVSRGDAILLAARAHDCEHWLFSSLRIRFPGACVRLLRHRRARRSEPPMAATSRCQLRGPADRRRGAETWRPPASERL